MSEGQFRRAIGIFSVVSSPSRLEILRQLNSKGPMSYSELKSSTGFRAKKESGKFAYHLRKLLRQGLIQHNRMDKKYSITPLGRLVLNAAREIDERALLHVEQIMLRTTRETLEPFNSNRLVQSLIKEAGMSRDAAQKVASEIEHLVAGREGLYLTSPMVREMASYILLMDGRDEERGRFAKLGISAWDLESLLSASPGIQSSIRVAGLRALRERELFSVYPKDVVDAHLEGELNIRDMGTSTLSPDYVSVPLELIGGSLERLLSLALSTRVELSIVVPDGSDARGLRGMLSEAEMALRAYGWPVLLNAVLTDEDLLEVAEGLRGGEGSRLAFTLAFRGSQRAALDMASRGLAVATSQGDALRSFAGAPVDPGLPIVSVAGASVNVPRLSYETQGDEAYFSARLLQVVEKASIALEHRLRHISRSTDGHLRLPGAEVMGFVNVIGYAESPPAVGLGQGLVKLIEGAGVRAAFLYDNLSARRLRHLDAERMPPTELPRAPGWILEGYTSGHYSPDGARLQAPPPAYTLVVQSHEARELPSGQVSLVPTFRVCRACGSLNPPGATSCSKCGSSSLSPLYDGVLVP
ncbi:MAG: DUF7347 domain-containing protein [Conexivisphaera sp.]